MTASSDPKSRFTSRVADYVKYRPGYPAAIIAVLRERVGLSPSWTIADVGCGTGISSEVFLKYGNRVVGIEPNDAMREAAGEMLRGHGNAIELRKGSAENTGLEGASVDLVVAAQAFHWFDRAAFRLECLRISRPPHRVLLMWNQRRVDSTPFLAGYERLLLEYCPDYSKVRHENVQGHSLDEFFGKHHYQTEQLENKQVLDLSGFLGRVSSSSYAPMEGQPNHRELFEKLRVLFDRHQRNNVVSFDYDTMLYFGSLS